MKADLHVHTDISDSSLSLEDTLKIAKANGVTHLGITNHDTVRGLKEAIAEGEKAGIKVIPGIEISAYDYENKRKVHILGYNFNIEGENIKKLCDVILKRRLENSIKHIEILRDNDYIIDCSRIYSKAETSEVIYKQHIMDELMENGYTDSIYSDLYNKLFKGHGICSQDIEYVDACEAVKAIKKDNGIAVLAHPGQLNSYGIIDGLVKAGLDGIEVYHVNHTEEDIRRIRAYRDKYNLILTGGSDFHGSYGTEVNIGEITSPEEYLYFFDENLMRDEEVLEFTEGIVRRAGIQLRAAAKEKYDLNFKNNDCWDIVTNYDVETEDFLVRNIMEKYPHHSFITEEKTSKNQHFSKYTWIIDPIDGTANFVSIGKEYAISVALYKDKKFFVGVVYDVSKGNMYSAIAGKGAFLNGIPIKKRPDSCRLKDSLIDISLNSINRFKKNKDIDISQLVNHIRGHRAYGSASLSICKIASGELHGYISAKLSIWDYAAAVIILEESGGCHEVIDAEKYFHEEPAVFIAAGNENIKSEVCRILGI